MQRNRQTTTAPLRAPAASSAAPSPASAAICSWRQRKLLPQFGCGHLLAIAGAAALEAPRIGKFADNDGVKASVAHESGSDLDCNNIVAGNRYRQLGVGAARLL